MKLLMLSNYSAHNKNVMQVTMKNHLDYCCRWGIDCIYTTGPYSPHNNFHQLQTFMDYYDRIITVGTDILFTDMNKDIRDFCTDHFIMIQLQDSRDSYAVNGDFIIWNSAYGGRQLKEFEKLDVYYKDTQTAINKLRKDDLWKIETLPCRTLQSVLRCPWTPAKSLARPESLWQPGDFSAHAYTPDVRPDVGYKEKALQWFLKEHPQFS